MDSQPALPEGSPVESAAKGHSTANGAALPVHEIPAITPEAFRRECLQTCARGARLAALAALPGLPERPADLLAVLAHDGGRRLALLRTRLAADLAYPALTPDLPQAQAFERALFEEHGIRPNGHPWLKPLRRPHHEFFRVEGAGIHEVAVGPVHAGIIEPGHFRFQCHGETVLHLEVQLGYQHRGAQALLLRSGPARRIVVAESIAGDTVIGHAMAYCQVVESLGGAAVPPAAAAIRGLALELERTANHAGDLGSLSNDVAYLPGASWFGRLRGEFLNLLMELSGNRFGRSLVRPGGVRFGLTPAQRTSFARRLAAAGRDFERAADLTFSSPSLGSRFERTGLVSRTEAEALGLVGPAARASGCDRDVRRDHPFAVYASEGVPVALATDGDVMARAEVRRQESVHSLAFAQRILERLPEGPLAVPVGGAPPGTLAIALVEGWRGEILHLATTDDRGELAGYTIVDPSFHNWLGLAWAMRGNPISDFPLCNKSFNLSYAGHDL